MRVRGVRLAGHAGMPEELGAVGYDNWYESVVNGLEDLRQYGEPIVVVGLSMGAVLSARLAADQRRGGRGTRDAGARIFSCRPRPASRCGGCAACSDRSLKVFYLLNPGRL